MELDGKRLTDIKDKKVMPQKIACALKDMKVDGWVNLELYHLNTHNFPMFKALRDLFNGELKSKLLNQKAGKMDEMIISSKTSPVK
jgi:hypothetical protein